MYTWEVQEHILGKGDLSGMALGPRTGEYHSEIKAIEAMCRAYLDGNGAHCIRTHTSSGKKEAYRLGLKKMGLS